MPDAEREVVMLVSIRYYGNEGEGPKIVDRVTKEMRLQFGGPRVDVREVEPRHPSVVEMPEPEVAIVYTDGMYLNVKTGATGTTRTFTRPKLADRYPYQRVGAEIFDCNACGAPLVDGVPAIDVDGEPMHLECAVHGGEVDL